MVAKAMMQSLPTGLDLSALGLMFMLGLRHGLDPDHIAMIDNMVFSVNQRRPRLAAWIGTLFALGHSLGVAVVALLVAAVAHRLSPPAWFAPASEVMVLAMLLVVGIANLHGLLKPAPFRPTGWRSRLLAGWIDKLDRPVSILGVGLMFGLVFDTITQAAAWGATATTRGGPAAVLALIGVFSAGMILVDTIDSQIVARVLRSMRKQRIERFRRLVGWLVVTLSLGAAAYIMLDALTLVGSLPGHAATTIGVLTVIAMPVLGLLAAHWRGRRAR